MAEVSTAEWISKPKSFLCWRQKYVKCHRAAHEENGTIIKPKKDLRLDAAWAILKEKGGETKDHPVLVPRDSAKSYIYEVITQDDDMFINQGRTSHSSGGCPAEDLD